MTSSAMLRVLLKGAWNAGVPLTLVSCSTYCLVTMWRLAEPGMSLLKSYCPAATYPGKHAAPAALICGQKTRSHAVMMAETTHLQIHLVGANAEAAHSEQLLGIFQCAALELHLAPDAQHVDVLYSLIQLFRR